MYKSFIIVLVITIAVNIDNATPIASVTANPLTVPEPRRYRTSAAIRVVMLPSRIADIAFLKPCSIADSTLLPRPISSLIRAKITTLASTAIPIESMIPAIPESVSVTSYILSRKMSKAT